jgi:murein DD-endopeptidase MepM/ murein hydrolase activator NlpD
MSSLSPTPSFEDRLAAVERQIEVVKAALAALNPPPITVPVGTSGSMTLSPLPLSPVGYVTPKTPDGANVRSARLVIKDTFRYTLAYGDSRRVLGKERVGDYLWYALEDGYVREDVVTFSADAPVAPPPVSGKWPAPTTGYRLTTHHGEGGHKGIDMATGGLRPPVFIGPNGGTVVRTFLCAICKSDGDGSWTVGVPGYGDGFGTHAIVRYPRSALPEAARPHVREYVFTIYAHLSALNVRQGNTYPAGHILGHVGSTGNSTGNHLHLEVRTSDNPNENFYSAALVDPESVFEV